VFLLYISSDGLIQLVSVLVLVCDRIASNHRQIREQIARGGSNQSGLAALHSMAFSLQSLQPVGTACMTLMRDNPLTALPKTAQCCAAM